MNAKIIDGNKIAEDIKQEIKTELSKLKDKPALVAVQVGENLSSKVYVKNQKASCEEVGIKYNLVQLAENISEKNAYKIKNNKDGNINFAIILTEIALKPKTFPKSKILFFPELLVLACRPSFFFLLF